MKEKRRWISVFALTLITLLVFLSQIEVSEAYAGKVCGSTSPCVCGANCSGGNELFGNSQATCDADPIMCFNTIDNCRDGTILSFNYVKDISVTSLNNSVFRVGDVIEIDATLHSGSANVEGVYFVYANQSSNVSVNWTLIYEDSFGVSDSNYHIRFNHTIPNFIGEHTVRVIDILGADDAGSALTCGRDSSNFPLYSDTDDVTFTVLAQPPPDVGFADPTPSNNSAQAAVTITLNITHNETHPDTLTLDWNGTNETYSYSGGHTIITKTNLVASNYSFKVYANDTFGNTNVTETRVVQVTTPLDVVINAPPNNLQTTNATQNLNVTAEPTQEGQNLSAVWYQLNDQNTTITNKKFNISSDTSDPGGVLNQSLNLPPNLSQSFMPSTLMKVKEFSIRIKRVGLPNATIQIRSDANNNPSNTVLANVSINNNSVSNTEYSWVNFTLNNTVTLQNHTRYWLFLSGNGSLDDHYAWETNDENTSLEGALLQNTSQDALFRIFDAFKHRTTITLPEGVSNLTVYANNSAGVVVPSSTFTLTQDTTGPQFSSITESEDPVELGNNFTISIIVSDASTSVNTVIFEFNSTNHTLNPSGSNYSATIPTNGVGSMNYLIYMNDSLGNTNVTSLLSVTIQDSVPPTISSISNSPSISDDLDPGVLINVTATITDSGNVSGAILQYKNETGNWTNATMQNTSTLFWGNFTPHVAGNWTYRIWANDSSQNGNFSANSTLDISLEYSWTRIPSTFGALSGIKTEKAILGNLTINNTGDYVLSFDLSSSQLFVDFNKSDPFTIDAGNYEVVHVNATTPLAEAEYAIVLTIDAENGTAAPSSLQTNATLVSITSGPYLFVEIIQHNGTLPLDSFTNVVAKITNIGNETAFNISSNWSIPSDWDNVPNDLNQSIPNLTVNEIGYHNMTFIIEDDDSTGDKTITFAAGADNSETSSASKTVTVTGTTTTTTTTSSSGGSSGGGGGGGGGSLVVYTKPDYDVRIDAPSLLQAIIEERKRFSIEITNTVEETVLENVEFSLEGFLITKMEMEPKTVSSLPYLESAVVDVTLDIPQYWKQQNRTLTFKVEGDGRDPEDAPDNTRSHALMEKTHDISLLVLEVTEEVARERLRAANDTINELRAQGFNTQILERLLMEASQAFERSDYQEVILLSGEIQELKINAFAADNLIEEVRNRISSAEEKGAHLEEVSDFLDLAAKLLEQGRFDEAEELANKALLAERIGEKTEEAKFLQQFSRVILANWWVFLAILLLGSTGSFFVRREFTIKGIRSHMQELQKEDEAIMELIKRTQEEYFKKRLMSERLYEKSLEQYLLRLASIQKQKVSLNSRKITLLKVTGDKDALEKEKEELRELMKRLQQKYYVKKIVTKDTYKTTISEYKKRLAEIDKLLEMIKGGKKVLLEKIRNSSVFIFNKKQGGSL